MPEPACASAMLATLAIAVWMLAAPAQAHGRLDVATRGREHHKEAAAVRLRDLADTLRNRSFRLLFVAYVLGWAPLNVIGAVSVYFAVYRMGYSEDYAGLVMLTWFLVGVAWLPLVAWMSKRYGKRATYISDNKIIRASGNDVVDAIDLHRDLSPAAHELPTDVLLAAISGAWALGMDAQLIRTGLETYGTVDTQTLVIA